MKIDFIILASGHGKRLPEELRQHPKVLLKIGKTTLLENHVNGIKKLLGDKLGNIYVTARYKKDELKSFIRKNNLDVIVIEDPQNLEKCTKYGRTLYHALKKVENNYVIYVMGDHYIDYEALSKKIKVEKKLFNGFALILDDGELCPTRDSQSKALVKNGKIVKFGKEISEFNFYDVGLFFTKRDDFQKVVKEEKLYTKDFDTADLLKSKLGKTARYLETHSLFWFGCNTLKDLQKAMEYYIRLKGDVEDIKSAQSHAGILTKFIYRKFDIWLTYLLLKINPKLRPESVVVGRFLFFLFLLVPYYIFTKDLLLFAIGLLLTDRLDGVDGLIARLMYKKTEFGRIIDYTVDWIILAIAVFFVGMFENMEILGTVTGLLILINLLFPKRITKGIAEPKKLKEKGIQLRLTGDIVYTGLIICSCIKSLLVLWILITSMYYFTSLIIRVRFFFHSH